MLDLREYYELLSTGLDQTVTTNKVFILGLKVLAIYWATIASRHFRNNNNYSSCISETL